MIGSDNMEAILRATLRARDDLLRALRAIPDERRRWRPAGAARSAVRIVAHCAVSNLMTAATLMGDPMPFLSQEQADGEAQACDSATQAEEMLQRSVRAVCDALVAIGPDRPHGLILMPWGERLPALLALMSPTLHMQQHEGQLEYIQTLLGDDQHH